MEFKYIKNKIILLLGVLLAIGILSCSDKSDAPALSMTSFQTYIDKNGNEKYVIDSTSCGIQGRIYVDGGAPITSRGVCWKIKANDGDTIPSVDNIFREADLGTGTGLYEVDVDGLIPDTVYHMRTYAINADSKIGYGWVLRVPTYSTTIE